MVAVAAALALLGAALGLVGVGPSEVEEQADGLHGGGALGEPVGLVGVVAGAVDEDGDALVPDAGLAGGGHGPVGVVAGVVEEDADGLVGGGGLTVAVADVAVVAVEVVQKAVGEVVAAALRELAGLVLVIAGEVVDGAEASGGVAPEPDAEALAEALVDVRGAVDRAEVGAVGFVVVLALRVDDRAESSRAADALGELLAEVGVVPVVVDDEPGAVVAAADTPAGLGACVLVVIIAGAVDEDADAEEAGADRAVGGGAVGVVAGAVIDHGEAHDGGCRAAEGVGGHVGVVAGEVDDVVVWSGEAVVGLAEGVGVVASDVVDVCDDGHVVGVGAVPADDADEAAGESFDAEDVAGDVAAEVFGNLAHDAGVAVGAADAFPLEDDVAGEEDVGEEGADGALGGVDGADLGLGVRAADGDIGALPGDEASEVVAELGEVEAVGGGVEGLLVEFGQIEGVGDECLDVLVGEGVVGVERAADEDGELGLDGVD